MTSHIIEAPSSDRHRGCASVGPSLCVSEGWQVPQGLSELIVKRLALRCELFL